MGKRNIKTSGAAPSSFPAIKAYSVDEILAAGGTTAFAEKMGKNFNNIEERFKKLPANAFLTDEEFDAAIKTLNESK